MLVIYNFFRCEICWQHGYAGIIVSYEIIHTQMLINGAFVNVYSSCDVYESTIRLFWLGEQPTDGRTKNIP